MNAEVERTFELLERAAIYGERCPKSNGRGAPLMKDHISILAYAGRIRVEIYARNFRVVTLLDGPHAGKHTALPPDKSWKPYKVIQRHFA